jgi:hypothetical protein
MYNDRFKDAIWYPYLKGKKIIVGGAGGISSWLTLLLSRIGIVCIVFDDDIFEEHNVGGQFVRWSQVGDRKIVALKNNVSDFSKINIQGVNAKYDTTSITSSIMLSGFDNMEARRIMYHRWKENNQNDQNALLIDGRLLFEQIQIFCVTTDPEIMKRYEENFLFGDEDVENLSCTTTQTSHTAAMIASLMTAFLTNHAANIITGEKYRTVPFYYEYFVPLLKTDIVL